MNKVRIELWLNGTRAIRSQPIEADYADARIGLWREVFGSKADIRMEVA